MLKKTVLLSIVAALCVLSCTDQSSNGDKKNHTITIAGSTSVMPFTEKLAEHFALDHANFIIDVQGGGSTAGIQASLNRTVNIGMSSRELKDNEKILKAITICHDGIAVIVNPKNPVRALSLRDIREVYQGKITNWNRFGWINRKIDAVTREEGSGTRSAFEELVMKKGSDIDDGIMVQDSNGSVKEVVATDPYAIGFVSLGLVDKRVNAVAVEGIMPTIQAIKTNKYHIVRPFLYVVNGELDKNAKVFVDYILSREGQTILKKEGLVGSYD